MKKILAAIVCLTLMLTCVAGVAEWKFERDVEVLVPASAGGGLDTTIRVFATHLEKELGVNVIIDNRAGGSHVVGMTYAYTQPRDGYTFQFMGPSTISSAAQGLFSVPMWDEMVPAYGHSGYSEYLGHRRMHAHGSDRRGPERTDGACGSARTGGCSGP